MSLANFCVAGQERMMAKRAKVKTVEVNASLVSYMSHPKETAKLIEEAATSAHANQWPIGLYVPNEKHVLRHGRSRLVRRRSKSKSNGPSGSLP